VSETTLLILVSSILLATYGRRAFWLGFALFGWAYLVASLIPPVELGLLTTKIIVYLDAKTANRQSLPIIVASSHESHSPLGWDEDSVRIWDTTGKPASWPRGSFASFRRIGHSLFSLLAGLLGAFMATWVQRRDERRP
jgi:hypothetical protein